MHPQTNALKTKFSMLPATFRAVTRTLRMFGYDPYNSATASRIYRNVVRAQ